MAKITQNARPLRHPRHGLILLLLIAVAVSTQIVVPFAYANPELIDIPISDDGNDDIFDPSDPLAGVRDYVAQVAEQYGVPQTISRIVKRDKLGALQSRDKSMQSILDLAAQVFRTHRAIEAQQYLERLELPDTGCFLSFAPGNQTNAQTFVFDVGTTVPNEKLDELEIFEERGTGRKHIRPKIDDAARRDKKGALMGRKWRKVDKREGGEGQEEEEDDDDDEEMPTRMSTYAVLRAIQYGRAGFGATPHLDMSNLPDDETIQSARVQAAVDDFFQKLIDACEGKMDGDELDMEEVVKTDADKPKKDFHIGEFLTRVRENDGKLETEEDQQLFDDEVQGMMDKMVRSVRVASDNERAEIRELAIKKKEAVANSNVDQAERDRLVQRKLDAYDFLKSVRFAISARPAFREFKRLSDAQYETVLSLAAEGIDEQQPQRPLTEIEASTADAIIYARTAWYTKTGTFFKKVGQKIGKFFAKTFIWTAKKMKLLKSREKTSGELEREEQKKAKKEASLEAKRWKALHIAVRKLRFGEYEKCQRLQAPIQLALYGEGPMALADEHNGSAIREAHAKDGNKALADLHARLGAQLVNSMLNTKQFPEGHALALAMSVGGSGFIGVLLDVALVPLVILALTHMFGPIPHIGAALVIIIKFIIKPILESSTPLVAETFDSAIIKQYLDSLKGQKFWRGVKQFQKTLKGAVKSGKIAAIGSILLNFSQLWRNIYFLPVQLVFNAIATVASAAQVPVELEQDRDGLMKGMYLGMESGMFPPASEQFKEELAQKMRNAIAQSRERAWGLGKLFVRSVEGHRPPRPEEERARAYANWIEREAWRIMEIQQSTRLAISSLGIGPIVSSIVFTGMSALSHFVPALEGFVLAVSVMFNSPTEMISLTAAIVGANHLGLEKYPWLMSNDEQKNAQLIGMICEKTSAQLRDAGGNLVAITDQELHTIYNAKISTMGLGKAVARAGVWVLNKWSYFAQRNQHKMRKLSGTMEQSAKDSELIVHQWKRNVVYLITLPRTSTVQSLSPKAIALEFWLKAQQIPFYRIADGLLLRQLFSDEHLPLVEVNGERVRGPLKTIVQHLSDIFNKKEELDSSVEFHKLATFEQDNLVPLLNMLDGDRRVPGAMDYVVNDEGLLVEMISTMSQLYPKLVEFEFENVDTWDTLPWQLKTTFWLMLQQPNQHNNANNKQLADQSVVEQRNGDKFQEKRRKMAMLYISAIEAQLRKSAGGRAESVQFLFGEQPTYVDALLFGLLAQLFETPLSTVEKTQRLAEMRNDPTNPLAQFYHTAMQRVMGGEEWARLKEAPWTLNYDLVPRPLTDKYDGPFTFEDEGFFQKIAALIVQPVPDVAHIQKEMRKQKVPHKWFGNWWKVRKQWPEEEFQRELAIRTELRKWEMFGTEVEERLLKFYKPALTAVSDRLLDVVWESAKREFQDEHNEPDTPLAEAELALGTQIAATVNAYMAGEAHPQVEAETNAYVFHAYVHYDRLGEVLEQQVKGRILAVTDAFYDEQFKRTLVGLFTRDWEAKEAKALAAVSGNKLPTKMAAHQAKAAELKEREKLIKKLAAQVGTRPTIQDALVRVNRVYNSEISTGLSAAIAEIRNWGIEAILAPLAHINPCMARVFERQTVAIKYIDGNRKRLNQEKFRRGTISRLLRVFGRYAKLKRNLMKQCKDKVADLEQHIDHKFTATLRKEFTDAMEEAKSRWQKWFKAVEKERKERLKRIKYEYLLNEKMREYVKEKGIGEAPDARRMKKQLAEQLGTWELANFQGFMANTIKGLVEHQMEKSSSTRADKKLAELSNVEREIGAIMDQLPNVHAKAVTALRDIDSAQGKQAALLAIADVLQEYERIKALVKETVKPDFFSTERLKIHSNQRKVSGELLEKLKERIDQLNEMFEKVKTHNGGHTMKEVILAHLNLESREYVRVNVKEDKSFLRFIKWGKEMSAADVDAKYEALAELRAAIRADTESDVPGAFLARLQPAMAAIRHQHARRTSNMIGKYTTGDGGHQFRELAEAYDEELCLQHFAKRMPNHAQQIVNKMAGSLEFATVCGQRTVEFLRAQMTSMASELQLTEEEATELLDTLDTFHAEQLQRRTIEKLKRAKYPIAKALLHLAAAYLCEDRAPLPSSHGARCAQYHIKHAEQTLLTLTSNFDLQKLSAAVKSVVYHAIMDFNENFLIREKILKQYGMPLKAELEDVK